MNKLKFKYAIGLIAAAFIMVANLQYAFSEYGIPFASTLHINVLAQTSNGSGNSSTGSGSSGTTSGGTSSSGNGNNTGMEGECPDFNYVPNKSMSAVLSDAIIYSNSKGEIVINGMTKVGFEKNKEYYVIYEKRSCNDPDGGNCCDLRKATTKVFECKLKK